MLVGSKEKKIKGQHLISWGTLLSVWNSKWSELNFAGFWNCWSLDFSFSSTDNMVKLLCLMDKDGKDLNDMQEQLARQMGKKPKNSWVSRSVEIDDVDIKVLWTALRQKTYISSKGVSAWWSNPMCSCDTASPSYIAFHSVCEHFPQYTYVIQWTHVELYAHIISGLNILFLAQTPLFYLFSLNTL